MSIQFNLRKSDPLNYHQQNISDIIMSINDTEIQNAVNGNGIVHVNGPIHRSQMTSDNKENHYWMRLSVYDSTGQIVPGYGGIHVFMCFQLLQWTGNGYRHGQCVKPEPYKNTDIADISNMFGFWKMIRMTTGIQKTFNEIKSNTKYVPRERKPLVIMDPKTGKMIE